MSCMHAVASFVCGLEDQGKATEAAQVREAWRKEQAKQRSAAPAVKAAAAAPAGKASGAPRQGDDGCVTM